MLLQVQDGQGTPQTVITAGQETVTDLSGVITATGGSQVLASASTGRSGWFFQNQGVNNMFINELGAAATEVPAQDAGSICVPPLGILRAPADAPVTVAQLNVVGTSGDAYVFHQW